MTSGSALPSAPTPALPSAPTPMPRPRVVHVLRELAPGGIECWLNDVVEQGGIAGFALEVIVERRGGSLEPGWAERGIPIRRWSKYDPVGLYRLLRGAALVHSHVHAASGWVLAVAAAAGVPVRLAHSHTVADPAAGGPWRTLYATAMRWANECFATGRWAVSRRAAAALFGPGRRFVLAPLARDLSRIPERPRPARPLVDGGRIRLGHIGRLAPVKNHARLIEVLAAEPAWELLLAGEGPVRPALEGEAVARIGWRSPAQVLAEADCFVFPSWHEGLGLAAIEAQAAGLPLVLSTAVPEEAVIRPALVERVPPEAPAAAWAAAVRRVMVRAAGAGSDGWDRDRCPYHLPVQVRELSRLYAQALATATEGRG